MATFHTLKKALKSHPPLFLFLQVAQQFAHPTLIQFVAPTAKLIAMSVVWMLPIAKTDRTLFEWQAMASVAKVVCLQFSLVIVRSFFIFSAMFISWFLPIKVIKLIWFSRWHLPDCWWRQGGGQLCLPLLIPWNHLQGLHSDWRSREPTLVLHQDRQPRSAHIWPGGVGTLQLRLCNGSK